MENLFQSVVALQDRLRQAGILSAVIGGVAVGVWGEPRVTRDVDVKVLLGRDDAPRLLQVISPDYVPLQADPLDALTRLVESGQADEQISHLDERLGTLWLSVTEASQQWGVPVATVRYAASHGHIQAAEKQYSQWRFPQRTFLYWPSPTNHAAEKEPLPPRRGSLNPPHPSDLP